MLVVLRKPALPTLPSNDNAVVADEILTVARSSFEAARRISGLAPEHPASRLHGHSFVAHARFAELPKVGFSGAQTRIAFEQLQSATRSLDYRDLSAILEQADDAAVARHLWQSMPESTLEQCSLQSTPNQGVEISRSGQTHLWRRYRFEAAHRLPNVPPGHKCGRMHGHGFVAILHIAENASDSPSNRGYDRIDQAWGNIAPLLQHRCLNHIPGLEIPTSENLSRWIWNALQEYLPDLRWVTVFETGSCGSNYDGRDFRIWKDMTLDSAVQFDQAPPEDPLSQLHGHTFTLRLHLSAPLDPILGWTQDFGDVKELFTPIFKQLDHRFLNELAGISSPSPENIAQWVRQQAASALPALKRIDVFETPGVGSILNWADTPAALPI